MTAHADAREVARRVLRRVEADSAYASLALSSEIERAGLPPRDAALATELAMGVLRHRTRIDAALAKRMRPGSKISAKLRSIFRVGAYEILFVDGIPPRASVNEAVAAARAVGGQRVGGFVNAVLRGLAADGEPAFGETGLERVVTEHSLPAWIARHLAEEVPAEEFEAAAAAMSARPAVCLRVNRFATTREALVEVLEGEAPGAVISTHPHSATGLRAERLGSVARLPSFRRGEFTVQDAAAQRVVELVDPTAVRSALDACAGVGGKTTHLREHLGPDVPIDAVDKSASKLALLAESASRLKHEGIRSVEADLLGTEAALAEAYDLVVLDAPCSGLGVLRRHPEAKWRTEPAIVDELASVQEKLLDVVAARVAPGGQLIYSVCSFTSLEGAGQVARFLSRRADFALTDEIRLWPHRHDSDAFYAARLTRAGADGAIGGE